MYTIYKITAFILSNQTRCGKSNGMLPPLGEAGNIPLGICLLRNVSNALIHCCLYRNMPKAKALKKSKREILEPLETACCG